MKLWAWPDAVWPSLAEPWRHPKHPHRAFCAPDHYQCPLCFNSGYGDMWREKHAAKEHFLCDGCGRYFLYRRAAHRCEPRKRNSRKVLN